ncbi:MAG: DUF192 domain-containing protein [Oligoflexia bacterium]|nr:DUF192 domain-containing protein [Oligoflexia bacterium]
MLAKNRMVRAHSLKNHTLIADKCIESNSFLARARGLIGRKVLEPGEGMLFPNCNDIHMWFMSIPIDVVFLKREGGSTDNGNFYSIVSTHSGVRPWRALPLRDGRASETLELPEGTIARCVLKEGDRICIE